jgi:hypothetical protein
MVGSVTATLFWLELGVVCPRGKSNSISIAEPFVNAYEAVHAIDGVCL